jgi:hypothetical protein
MTSLDKKDIMTSKTLVCMGLLFLIVISQNACVSIASQTIQPRLINNNDGTVTDGEGERATAYIRLRKDFELMTDMINVTLTDESHTWTFDRDDFKHDPYSGADWSTERVDTKLSGLLKMNFKFIDDTNRIVASGSASVELRPDLEWSFVIAPGNTQVDCEWGCFGCFGSNRFPIKILEYAPNNHDSICITWGWNYIPNSVIY